MSHPPRPAFARVGHPGLAAALERAWTRDPAARPAMATVVDALERACSEIGPHAPDSPPPGASPPPDPDDYYEHGPGLALLFADEREPRWPRMRAALGAALARCGFGVSMLPAGNMLSQLRLELAAAKRDKALRRVLFGYAGHGRLHDAHPQGLLCGQTDYSGGWVRVSEIKDALAAAFPARGKAAVPKLLVLDCCYNRAVGQTLSVVPPPWDAHVEEPMVPHDIAVLRSTSEGGLQWAQLDGSFSFSHALADAMCDPSLHDLVAIKHAVAKRLEAAPFPTSNYKRMQPKLEDELNRRFSFLSRARVGNAAGGAAGGGGAGGGGGGGNRGGSGEQRVVVKAAVVGASAAASPGPRVASVLTLAGSGDKGFEGGSRAQAQFNEPVFAAALPSGALVVADTGNHCLRLVSLGGSSGSSSGGGDGRGGAGSVTMLAGRAGLAGFANGLAAYSCFSRPSGVAVAADGGAVFIADSDGNRIRCLKDGAVTTFAGSSKAGGSDGVGAAASFCCPWGLAFGPGGALYVTELEGRRVRVISPAGAVSTLATGLYRPAGIAVDAAGVVYVADLLHHCVRRIAPGAGGAGSAGSAIDTLAGGGEIGFADGAGAEARFNKPAGLALDPATGCLIVADLGNNRIRALDPRTGIVSTLAGSGVRGAADGDADAASFFRPMGVAVDARGGILVADAGNQRVRYITPAEPRGP